MSEPTEWPPEVLREAKPLSLMWFPESAAAKELAAGIARDIDASFGGEAKYKRGTAKLAKLSDATGAVVAGILLAQAGDGPKSVFKAMRNDYFTGCRISLDTYRAVRQGLEGLDLIDVKETLRFPRGFGFGGYAARMKPTPSLIALGAAAGITPDNVKEHFQARPNEYAPKLPRALVEVRTMQGLDPEEAPDNWHTVTPDPEGSQGRAIREEIERANERLAGHQFGGCLQPRLRRIFTTLSPAWDGRWWLGGRWYAIGPEGAYQTLPEALRAKITVDGEETVEVDVSASQLTLLMGRLGIERPAGGLYDIPGVPRPVVKQFVVQTLGNGRPVKRWRSDVPASIRAVPLEDAERAVLAVYPFLEAPYEDVMPEEMGERLMRKALAHRLMNIEAEALTTAMRLIWDAAPEAAVLPVHDSLIVARKHEGLALRALEEGYAQRCRGELPIVKRKGAS